VQGTSLANGTEKLTDWNAVNWRKANRAVRNLRQRIFRAVQEGNQKKVRSLQKLMVKSYSNRLVSVRRVTQMNAGKNTPGVDKLVLKTPVARGRMVDALAQYSFWKAKPARRVYIPKTNNKLRPLGIPIWAAHYLSFQAKFGIPYYSPLGGSEDPIHHRNAIVPQMTPFFECFSVSTVSWLAYAIE
jgi:hypothetical protein